MIKLLCFRKTPAGLKLILTIRLHETESASNYLRALNDTVQSSYPDEKIVWFDHQIGRAPTRFPFLPTL